jgi:hypothetical protein
LHALLVAGASGAGKSAFLSDLYSGRLASDIRGHLPSGADTWPLVYCNHPEQWRQFATETAATETAGIVIHHDVTLQWRRHQPDIARDPFWQLLQWCDGVTMVVLKPSLKRLLVQWSLAHLGMHPRKIRARKLVAAFARHLTSAIRLLRKPPPPSDPGRIRYPRPVRFLRRVDRGLRSYRMGRIGHFDFYSRPSNVDCMLDIWSEMIAAKTAALPVTRIEIDPESEIGQTARWLMRSLERRPPAVPFNLPTT